MTRLLRSHEGAFANCAPASTAASFVRVIHACEDLPDKAGHHRRAPRHAT